MKLQGVGASEIARTLNISRASVHRVRETEIMEMELGTPPPGKWAREPTHALNPRYGTHVRKNLGTNGF